MRKNLRLAMVVGGLAMGTMAAVAQTSAPQVKDDLFAGTEMFAKGATEVSEINMDSDTLGLVGGKNKARANNMVLNVIRTYEYDKPGMYRIEDVETFRNKLNTGDWHCSVHTRDLKHNESTDICNKQRADDLAEKAIITVEPKELTFIHTISKKNGYEGVGEFGPLEGGLGSFSVMAAMAPAQEAEMQAAMASMNVNGAKMHAQMLAGLKTLDTPEMQHRLNEAMKLTKQGADAEDDSDGVDAPEAPAAPLVSTPAPPALPTPPAPPASGPKQPE